MLQISGRTDDDYDDKQWQLMIGQLQDEPTGQLTKVSRRRKLV